MRLKIFTLTFISVLTLSSCSGIVNFFAFYPDTRSGFPGTMPAHIEELFISTEDNVRLQAYYFKKPEMHKQIIIYFHGNAGNLNHRIETASILYGMGYDILLVSYRGYARSEGRPSEKGVYLDGEAALDYAQNTLGFPEENIFLFGRSLGTTVCVHIAQNRKTAGVILITPLSSGREFAEGAGFGPLKYLAGRPFDSLKKINRLQSPILIIHGTRDEIIPYEQGVRLYDEYRGMKKFIKIEGGYHNTLERTDSALYYGSIEKFLKQTDHE